MYHRRSMEKSNLRCPICGYPVTVIVRGLPDEEALEELRQAGIDYQLAGDPVSSDTPDRRCGKCGYEWIEERREA
jgi:ribosomal protein S27AE